VDCANVRFCRILLLHFFASRPATLTCTVGTVWEACCALGIFTPGQASLHSLETVNCRGSGAAKGGTEMRRQPTSRIRLEDFTIEQLIEIRDRADEHIGRKLSEEKSALQAKLSAIERYERQSGAGQRAATPAVRKRRVEPKYRDPSSGATWAGRGQVPRWMAEHIKQGARREDFRIRDGERRG
jgi:DNA-binding protein H-NS